jgi:hypothetical protein
MTFDPELYDLSHKIIPKTLTFHPENTDLSSREGLWQLGLRYVNVFKGVGF